MGIALISFQFPVGFRHFLDQIWASQVRCCRSRVFHIANHLFWLSAEFQSCVLCFGLGHQLSHFLIQFITNFRHNSPLSPGLLWFEVNIFIIWILNQIHQELLSVANMLQRTPLPEVFLWVEMTARRELWMLPAVLVRNAVANFFPVLLSAGKVVAKRVRFNSTLSCFHQLSMRIVICNGEDWGIWFCDRVPSLQLFFQAQVNRVSRHYLQTIISLRFHVGEVAHLQRFEILPGMSLWFQISPIWDGWRELLAIVLRRPSDLRPWSKVARTEASIAQRGLLALSYVDLIAWNRVVLIGIQTNDRLSRSSLIYGWWPRKVILGGTWWRGSDGVIPIC